MPEEDLLLAAAIALAVMLRGCVGLWGYSGEGSPPMFGDYEAQRHWMEITINLPPAAWYVQGTDNDLQYWGIDYPPLSAHLSWLFGLIAGRLHPQLVELHSSRGFESGPTRAFMRNTVITCDAAIFFPAALLCVRHGVPAGGPRLRLLLQLLTVPAFVLIDHGHFQYNGVSLGLVLWAAYCCLASRPLAACVAFSLALNFKQMCLYLAPAFFCYLLAGCLRQPTNLARVAAVGRLGVVVLGTFAACWAPLLLAGSDASLAALRRIFPVERHLYEDKVANLWCSLSLLPFLKFKQILSISALLRLTLASTLLALLPPSLLLLRRPSRVGFLLSATACGLAFFLCSYQARPRTSEPRAMVASQLMRVLGLRAVGTSAPVAVGLHPHPWCPWQVHEKHILLPLLPATLLAPRQPMLFTWCEPFPFGPPQAAPSRSRPPSVTGSPARLGPLWVGRAAGLP